MSDLLVGQYVLAPTLMEYLGHDGVEFAGAPGRSFVPVLAGKEPLDAPDAVFFEQEDSGPAVLFDLEDDPGQRTDVAGDPAYTAVVADLDAQLTRFFERYANRRYDLWQGGRAKGS
ncbi:hypothetical protein ACFC4G_41685 [Streptomyces sp. NPDC056002]|uniref:hypothetical protein n=1 Tax=Streptomyces sp. NPDC056002 TaxID=3345675 RepID=UPI0035E13BCC